MNVQTERIENHKARFTVEVPPERWEKAKRQAAKALAKRYKIPGFRKGKAPYRIISRYLGEAPIIENAMEELGNQVYRDALDESGVRPYTSGSLEDFKDDPPTYVFTVPLEPEVELGDYRAVRQAYEAPIIDDEDVEKALRQIQQGEALVEESSAPIAVGNRVMIDIHSEFADGPEPDEDDDEDAEVSAEVEAEDAETSEADSEDDATEDDATEDDDADADDENVIYKGDAFINQHDAQIQLDPDDEPVLPGFIDALVGANVDDEVEFELTVPEDDENYADIAGRKVHFHVTVKKVEVVTLPELNDELAARVTEDDEDGPLSLLELRVRTRERLQEDAERQATESYASEVLDLITEQATVSFPPEMLSDRVHEMLNDLDRQLQQQGMNLETYQQITGTTHEDLHEQYEPEATASLKRSLVLGEIVTAENVQIDAQDIEDEVGRMLAQFGEQAEVFRQYFDTPQQRDNIANSLLYRRVMERIAMIGRGEDLDALDEAATEADAAADDADATPPEPASSVAEVEEESTDTAGAAEAVAETIDDSAEADDASAETKESTDD